MDPNQANHAAAAVAGMMGFFLLFGLAIAAFGIFLFWRILTKAGLSGPLALLILVPGVGWLIPICILAFSEWKVVPVATAPPYYPPTSYPPPPAYPPSTPPTQL